VGGLTDEQLQAARDLQRKAQWQLDLGEPPFSDSL
jgi:hypothetical protein